MDSFKICWTAVAQRRMQPLTIVKHLDELEDGCARSLSGGKALQVGQFCSQGAEKALHHGIVIGIAFAAHTHQNTIFLQASEIVVCGVLTTPVSVVDQVSPRCDVPPLLKP